MKKKIFAGVALLSLALAACAPSPDRPTLIPWLIKVSTQGYKGPAAAAPGETVTLQGRYLGGPSNSVVLFRADDRGNGGVQNTPADVVAWGANEIQIKVPANTRPGGGFVFVEVGGVLSNGLPLAVEQ